MESMESLSVVSTENDTIAEVRKSARRSSTSEQNLHKTNRRTICKPKKKNFDLDSGNQKAIKNFYLNINKSSKFKAIPLETIYEQDEDDEDVDDVNISSSSNPKDIGTRKIKRCLTVTTGLKANKTLSNKRKSQIKKHLGPRKRAKKISINNFMEYFKSQTNQTEDVLSSESTEVVTKEPGFVNLKKDLTKQGKRILLVFLFNFHVCKQIIILSHI